MSRQQCNEILTSHCSNCHGNILNSGSNLHTILHYIDTQKTDGIYRKDPIAGTPRNLRNERVFVITEFDTYNFFPV